MSKWPKTKTPKRLGEIAESCDYQATKWLRMELLWRQAHYWLLVIGTILAAIAGATAIAKVWNGILAGVLALTASALTALAAALTPAARATGCGTKAKQYYELARKAACEEDKAGEDHAAAQHAFYVLLKRFDEIRTSPEPPLPTAGRSLGGE